MRLLAALFFTCVFAAGILLFRQQVQHGVDLPLHIAFAEQYAAGKGSLPHPAFHLATAWTACATGMRVADAAVLVLALLLTITAVTVHTLLRWFLKDVCGAGAVLLLTAALMVTSALYAPFFNPHMYLGQSSPNIWHNPTVIMVKPFALVCTTLVVAFLNDKRLQARVGFYLGVALLLLLSAFAKPNYVFVLLPAVAVYLLLRHCCDWRLYGKTLLLFLPVLLVLGYQFTQAFAMRGAPVSRERDQIILDWFRLWHRWTPSIGVSLLLGLAFPLSVAACRFRAVLRNDYLVVAWLMTVMGALQFGLLAEKVKYKHGNFSWGYGIALTLLFLFTAVEYAKWLREPGPRSAGEKARLACASGVFALHVLTGWFYFCSVLSGRIRC